MTQIQVECFLAAAKAASFSTAAERMYMTPPTFGRQISSLEHELGFPLFYRQWKNSTLTPAGEVMYDGLLRLSSELNLLVSRAMDADHGISGSISFGMLEGQLIDRELRSIIVQFQSRYPGVELTLRHYSFHAMLEALSDGSLDVGITLSAELINHPEFRTLPLYSVDNDIVISEENPLSEQSDLTLKDFSGETFVEIERADSPIISGLMQDSCRRAGFIPHIHTVPDLEAQITAVELGNGIAAFNHYHHACNHPGLRHIPVPELPPVEFSLVWKQACSNPVLPCLVTVFEFASQKA